MARLLGWHPMDTLTSVEAFHIHAEQQLFQMATAANPPTQFGFAGATSIMCPMCSALQQGHQRKMSTCGTPSSERILTADSSC